MLTFSYIKNVRRNPRTPLKTLLRDLDGKEVHKSDELHPVTGKPRYFVIHKGTKFYVDRRDCDCTS